MKLRSYLPYVMVLLGLSTTQATAQFNDGFGAAVAITDGSVVVLKPKVGVGRAGAYSFRWTSGGWQVADALHPIGHDQTGHGYSGAVAAAPGLLVVAAGDPHALWAAHVFESGASAWRGTRIPLVEDAATRAAQPMSLALLSAISAPPARAVAISPDGSVLAVSDGAASGATVHVFRRMGEGEWTVSGELRATDPQPGDGFGAAVAIDSNHNVVVGAPNRGGSGAVFGFSPQAEGWAQSWTSRPDEPIAGGRFGAALAVFDEGVLVGAPGENVVRVIEPGPGHPTSLLARAPEGAAGFGASVSADGGEIWVGAPGTDETRGAVFRFVGIEARRGEPLGRLQPDGLQVGDGFGTAVSLAGGVGVVGLPFARAGRGAAAAYRWTADSWGEPGWLDAGTMLPAVTGAEVPCSDGTAAGFDCEGVDLLSFVPLEGLGAAEDESVSDLWGWADPETGREYALVGRSAGAAIVDVSDPANPVFIGWVRGNRTHARDIKVLGDYMFFTGDSAGEHGLLVFDLKHVRDVTAIPMEWEPDARYDEIASAHNLIINTETGFGFTVGNRAGGTTCGGGLHMVDLNDPLNPTFAGCYTDTEGLIWQGRTHDGQCVIYHGPDEEYQGREICFALNETAVRVVDVTDKSDPIPISAGRYPGLSYVHQGWLTEDHRFFYQNDEVDELTGMVDRTRTLVWNVEDLDDPVVVAEHLGPTNATDHNLYVVGNRMYQANYHAGMRVFDISDRVNPIEVGFFDTTPYGGDPPGYTGGAWTVYPFFESGTVIVSSMNEGLFVLRPHRPILP